VKTNTIRAETRTGIPARTKCGGDVTKYLVEIRQGDAVAIPPEEILAQSGFESPNRLAKCGEKGIRPHVAVYGVDLMSKKAGLRWRLIPCEGWRGAKP